MNSESYINYLVYGSRVWLLGMEATVITQVLDQIGDELLLYLDAGCHE